MKKEKYPNEEELQDYLKLAKDAERTGHWDDAYSNYENAANIYLSRYKSYHKGSNLKQDLSYEFLNTSFNSLINQIKFIIEESDNVRFNVYEEEILRIQKYRREFYKELLRPSQYYEICFRIERRFFLELYNFLLNRGFKEEAEEIFFMSEKSESERRFLRLKHLGKEKKYVKLILEMILYLSNKMFYFVLDKYGFRIEKVTIFGMLSVIFFAFIFYRVDCVSFIQTKQSLNFIDSLLGSLLLFIGYDFNLVTVKSSFGHLLIFLEGVIGLITMAGILAFIWRKIR